MEETAAVDLGTNKREEREEESDGLGLSFGFGFDVTCEHRHPHKLVRTEGAFSPKKAAPAPAAAISTSISTPASPHLPPLHLADMNEGEGDISGGHGPTTFFYNGGSGIYDPYDATARALQPFGNPFKSQLGMVGGGAAPLSLGGYPFFTPAQWQELKRQALIYKHIVNSAPIPPDLLVESRHVSNLPPLYPNVHRGGSGGGGGGCLNFNLRFTNNTDPEPGRCRRTDGKKWRCSRDVAPDMKYCERHMHRGRPRSRKPVEHRNNSKAAAAAGTTSAAPRSTATPDAAASPPLLLQPSSKPPTSEDTPTGILPKSHVMLPLLSMVPAEKDPRYLGWMKGDNNMRLQMSNKIYDGLGTAASGLLRPYGESYADLNNDPCHAFLNHDLSSLEEEEGGPPRDNRHYHPVLVPRRFIDAWSSESAVTSTTTTANPPASLSTSPVSGSSGKLSPSTLTLSMCGAGEASQDSIDMGLGGTNNDSVAVVVKSHSHPLSWMNSATPLGGPLAEVLQSSTTAPTHVEGGSYAGLFNLMSKGCCYEEMGGKDSPPRFPSASSPTGVLQRTFVSPSDSGGGGGNSSPTFQSGSRSEIGLQWMMSHIK